MKPYSFLSILLFASTLSCSSPDSTPTVNYSATTVSTPTLFGEGVISTTQNSEFELTISTDGRSIYFTRRAPEEKQKIYQSEFVNGSWSNPTLAPFSTDRDETTHITPDGNYLFFGSERPIPGKPNLGNFDMNVWMMEKVGEEWSEPTPLPEPINAVQEEGEQWPSSNNNFFFTNDNRTFYFTTMMRGSESIKLYTTQFDGTTFTDPEEVTGIFEDEKYWVYSAVISPDGNYLVFNSYGIPDSGGGEDLFVSKKTETGWSRAQPMGALINTGDEESSPRFSRDGKYFFFSRAKNLGNYEYGQWNIFFVETEYLGLEALFE